MNAKVLTETIEALPDERQCEIADFVEFIRQQEEQRQRNWQVTVEAMEAAEAPKPRQRDRKVVRLANGSLVRTCIAVWIAVFVLAPDTQILSATNSSALTPIVYYCPRGRSGADQSLRVAIQQAIATSEHIEFLPDDRPCVYTGQLARALDRKLGKRYFALARGHEYSWIRVNGDFFSVERYRFDDVRTAYQVRERLSELPDQGLPGPDVTAYEFVQIGNTLVLHVADIHAREATEPLFKTIVVNLRMASTSIP